MNIIPLGIDPELLRGRKGDPGTGIVTSMKAFQWLVGQQVGGMSGFLPVGPSADICDPLAARVRVQIAGQIGHNQSEIITHLTVTRDGVALHPAGATGLSCVRQVSPSRLEPFSIDLIDVLPGDKIGQQVLYRLSWHTLAGTVFMGRRPADLIMNVPLTCTLTGLL